MYHLAVDKPLDAAAVAERLYAAISCRVPTAIGGAGRERNVLFNDALNTFYLRLYGV